MHRSQGSEYPYVIVPMLISARLLLQRQLLYTALTHRIRHASTRDSRMPTPRARTTGQLAWD